MQVIKSPRRPLVFCIIIAVAVLIVVNTFIVPIIRDARVTDVDYGTFLRMLEDGEVSHVQVKDPMIYFIKDGDVSNGIYAAARMEDPSLVDRLYAQEHVEFDEIVRETSPWLLFMLAWLLPLGVIALTGGLLLWYMTRRTGGMGADVMRFGKADARIYVAAQTGKTFDDVAGEDEAKAALKEIVDFLHNPSRYAAIGARLPKGALLVGPPGTGKTLLARAVAGEAKVPFFSISGSEFVEMFVGMGASKVRDLFRQAAAKAPCIIFIDEIDTIGKHRDMTAGGGADEREQTLNQLLNEMDGFDPARGVVILAATNRPESLDPALLRPGRFDRRIPVELPDLAGRVAILGVHAKNVKCTDDIDLEAIGRATAGFSGAELANIVNEAALRAVREGRPRVCQSDLEESIEVVMAGYRRSGAIISQRDRKIAAYHEIGHAMASALTSGASQVSKVTIIPRTSGTLGFTMQSGGEEDRMLMTREEACARLITLTAGRAAEELVFGTVTTGAQSDIRQATELARAMVTRYGMSERFDMVALAGKRGQYLGTAEIMDCSETTRAAVDEEVQRLIRDSRLQAYALLKENLTRLHTLAAHLMEKESLTGEEFMALMNQ